MKRLLLIATLAATIVIAAACSGGGGGGGSATPTPTPTFAPALTFDLDGAAQDFSHGTGPYGDATWFQSDYTCTITGALSSTNATHSTLEISIQRPCVGTFACTPSFLYYEDASGVPFVTASTSAGCSITVNTIDSGASGVLDVTFSGVVEALGSSQTHTITSGHAHVGRYP